MNRTEKSLTVLTTLICQIIFVIIFSFGCSRNVPNDKTKATGLVPVDTSNLPPQPGEETWRFIEDLKSPLWSHHPWGTAKAASHDADISAGVSLKAGFPDPGKRLETAYKDLHLFLDAGSVPGENGPFTIETVKAPGIEKQAFRLETGPKSCRIIASDIEGVRHGIFYIEDEMLRKRGPFLPRGTVEKKPFIKERISRCFFGPIKRFPKMRDELMDDIDYYPDEYLNRLAHEGVNGLWLTIEFSDLVSTKYTPDAGVNGEKRLAKLRKTVEKCLRYGIKTYIFCIEPRAWDGNNPVLEKYPELGGVQRGTGKTFCPISETAHKYLYETVNKIFRAVPDLGGMINITHGERATTCLSAINALTDYKGKINCPRCKDKQPWEILYASLSAMEKGMHDAAPDAELISWLYMPQPQRYVTGDNYAIADWAYDIPAHTPKGVILQFNYESGVTTNVFGKELVGGDYWISIPGPSSRFDRIAKVARENNTPVSAKIQTGNSHEVATVPYVPVPSLLYRKFAGMRELGVSASMFCWYFGNYPGMMNKAAGELSFEPFPKDENTFLHQLASIYWKESDTAAVVKAWKFFSEGYENYPLLNLFQYYGPMHDGPVWPLLLKPADAMLAPTWLLGSTSTRKPWPPSGDRIGESIGEVLTLEETTELARRMTMAWDSGAKIMSRLEPIYSNEPDRILDIGVAKALDIQFRSGYNILRFYLLREEMFRTKGRKRLQMLDELTNIITEEKELSKNLIELCERDSRLGFHSEAEGYKYFPAKLKWRIQQLQNVLDNDVPEMRSLIRSNKMLFPEYTGEKPSGPVAYAVKSESSPWQNSSYDNLGLKWQSCTFNPSKQPVQWAAGYDTGFLYIMVRDSGAVNNTSSVPANVQLKIETQRLFPSRRYVFYPDDKNSADKVQSSGEYTVIRIPFRKLGLNAEQLHPIRLDVRVQKRTGGTTSWRPDNPWTVRNELGTDNPADLGWLLFSRK